jgi:hypothetical protein
MLFVQAPNRYKDCFGVQESVVGGALRQNLNLCGITGMMIRWRRGVTAPARHAPGDEWNIIGIYVDVGTLRMHPHRCLNGPMMLSHSSTGSRDSRTIAPRS